MAPDAPLLHEDLFTQGVEPAPDDALQRRQARPSGCWATSRAGFAQADEIVERTFRHRGGASGIHRAPRLPRPAWAQDGQGELWCCTQGHFIGARHLRPPARHRHLRAPGHGLGDRRRLRRQDHGLHRAGGARPLAQGRPAGQAADVPRRGVPCHRPDLGQPTVRVKIGATKDGRITAGEAELKYQAGAFQGSPVQPGAMSAFAPYDAGARRTVVGYDVVVNRPKVAAYRAPGAPIVGVRGGASLDELARQLGLDPIELRLKNAAKEGTSRATVRSSARSAWSRPWRRQEGPPHYHAPARAPTRAAAWPPDSGSTIGGETCATININEDGTVGLATGTPDIGGSRASICHDGGRGARHPDWSGSGPSSPTPTRSATPS